MVDRYNRLSIDTVKSFHNSVSNLSFDLFSVDVRLLNKENITYLVVVMDENSNMMDT